MLYIPFPFKRCPTCKAFKPFIAFGNSRSRSDGLQTRCKACRKVFRDKNKDRINEQQREYLRLHGDERNAHTRADRQQNPDKYRARDKARYQRDRDKRLALTYAARARNPEPHRRGNRKYLENHREEINEKNRVYKRTHRAQATINTQRYRALKRSLPATFTKEDWHRALDYFDGRCAYCGRGPGLWHTISRDHFIPQSRGGTYTPDNILPVCHDKKEGRGGCNNSKSYRDPIEWLTEHFGKQKAKAILKHIQDYFDSLKE